MLFAAHRLGGVRGVVTLLLLTFGVGIYASEIAARSDPAAAFYLAPLRFYEFALGGLGTVLVRRIEWRQKMPWLLSAVTLLGVLLILGSTIFFNSQLPLPGVLMLLPLFGALLIILAGPSPIARILLSNPMMSWLGKVSYSLYLVHWPIIVFYRQHFEAHPSSLQLVGLFAVMLIAAMLMNRYVEQRFRLSHGGNSTAGGMSISSALWCTGGAVLLILIVSGSLIVSKGWPSRIPHAALALMEIDVGVDRISRKQYLEDTCTPTAGSFCGERTQGKRTILLLADSRGIDMYIALREAYPQANVMVAYAPGCPPTFSHVVGSEMFFKKCSEFNQARLKEALAAPEQDIIFLAADLSIWREKAMLETVRRFRASGKTVFLLGQFAITGKKSPVDIAIGAIRFHDENYLERFIGEDPFRLDGDYAEKIKALGAVYVSNKPLFYDGRYHLDDRQTGKLLTEDGNHLNTFGARKFGQYLRAKYPLP
jgi:hypothetical protein